MEGFGGEKEGGRRFPSEQHWCELIGKPLESR